MKKPVLCLALLILGLGEINAEEAKGAGGKAASAVLAGQFRLVMAEIIELMKSDRRMPHDMSEQAIKEKIDSAAETYQKLGVFDATPEQEAQYKSGKFDDAANIERLKEMITFLKRAKIDLPMTTVYAAKHLEAGDLKGARLELCVRLVDLNVEKIKSVTGAAP